MAKRTRKDRMEDKLPKFTSPTSVIIGFVPDDWQIGLPDIYPYQKCCQDPGNWSGQGEWQELEDGDLSPPCGLQGRCYCRDVYCSCGVHVIANEYAVNVNGKEAPDA